jgi:hypothetical protein
MDEPRYGYGKGERPLWSRRDRDSEAIRRVLRRGGFHDVDEGHLDGFAVEGANSSEDGRERYTVAYCGEASTALATLRRYTGLLQQAGYRVGPDPDDEQTLLVKWQPAYAVQKVLRPGQSLLRMAIACAVLATVALIASWAGTGQVRLAGGIGSGVLGAMAAFLAA